MFKVGGEEVGAVERDFSVSFDDLGAGDDGSLESEAWSMGRSVRVTGWVTGPQLGVARE